MPDSSLDLRQFTPGLACPEVASPTASEAEPPIPGTLPAQEPDARTRAWCEAVFTGFNESDPSDVAIRRVAAAAKHTGSLLTEVSADTPSPDPDLAQRPVGTFAVFDGEVNLGAGRMVPAAQITSVTVRPTHKRRGILRSMMTHNLAQLAERHVPLALLTATNAVLYGRYGFQTVLRESQVSVASGPGFALRTGMTGRVEAVTLAWLLPRMPEVFALYHQRMRGSTTRFEGYYEDLYLDARSEKVDGKYLAAVHIDDNRELDGYVTFEFQEPSRLKVRELVAATPGAELALWDHLNRVELVKEITAGTLPEDSLLPLALLDERALRTNAVSDALWARILDPVQVLEERAYSVAARRAHLQAEFLVEDDLGHASGAYRVALSPQGPQVHRLAEAGPGAPDPDVAAFPRVSVQALAALVFGSATTTQLAAAQMITGAEDPVRETMDALFAPVGRAGFLSHF